MSTAFLKRFFNRARLAMLTAALMPAMALAAQWDLDQLMQSLAKTKTGHASFIEWKYVAVLDKPIESTGELFYNAPNRLEKKTLKPKPETMLLDGETLVMERGKQKHTMQLQEYPELAGFIDSIRGTLAGDRKALERSFKLKLEGPAERWTLKLTPTDTRMARAVQYIEITGNRDNVRTIEIKQMDGDRSLMTIERISAQ